MQRVLVLSAYEARSHAYWLERLQESLPSSYEWHVLSLPPRHFNWRIRGNSLYWSVSERERLEQSYDAVLATSMVDLATLRGLVPALTQTVNCLYFHENQFAYPGSERQHSVIESQMVTLYGALAADRVAFNSAYNRRTFLAGVDALLDRLPDFVPEGVSRRIEDKSRVLPVPIRSPDDGIAAAWPGTSGGTGGPLRIAWLGRFEYDKGPDILLHTLSVLEEAGIAYELALVGQEFRQLPEDFATLRTAYSHRIVHWGFIESDVQYRAVLAGAEVALSTARHEFQGLALLEATALGAFPIVPARQAYPEIFPEQCCYPVEEGNAVLEGHHAAQKILACLPSIRAGVTTPPSVENFFPEKLAAGYCDFLSRRDSP